MKKFTFLFLIAPVLSWAQSSFQEDLTGVIQYNSGQVLSLAEAIPADKYDWRPMEGVRSVGECLMHIASSNYFFAKINGAQLPEGINPQEMEKTVTAKEDIIAAVKKSYDFIIESGKSTSDEALGEEITYPTGDKFNKRTNLMIASSHGAEHMGQLVAYARSNGITPPWSMASEDKEGEQ